MKQFDWTQPQRQPMAGLAIIFLDTFWEVLKRVWPFLLLMLFGGDKNKSNRYELIALFFLAFTIISAIIRFIYFRFYIEGDKLMIKSGWFKKETKIIPLERIQSVHIEAGPLHQLLNIVKLSIDTAGSQKAEATIDALHKSMAEALKQQLESEKTESVEETKAELKEPVLRLTSKDLLRLSISANHVEAFFILLSFGVGLYENLKDINNNIFSSMEEFLPKQAVYPILFLVISIFVITILVSTARTFLRFYDLHVLNTNKGFQVRSGLLNVKERLVPSSKVQFVSWKANWIRKLMDLWLVEYHISGGDELKQNQKVQVPVTRNQHISLLVKSYYEAPSIANKFSVRIHSSYVFRRLVVFGLFPSAIIIPVLWLFWKEYSLFFVIYPIILLISLICFQKKFRLWGLEDIIHIKKGIFGEEKIILQWHKLQSVQIQQSIFQRRNNLATLMIHTAGGTITIPFIALTAARQLVNFALFKTESSHRNWM